MKRELLIRELTTITKKKKLLPPFTQQRPVVHLSWETEVLFFFFLVVALSKIRKDGDYNYLLFDFFFSYLFVTYLLFLFSFSYLSSSTIVLKRRVARKNAAEQTQIRDVRESLFVCLFVCFYFPSFSFLYILTPLFFFFRFEVDLNKELIVMRVPQVPERNNNKKKKKEAELLQLFFSAGVCVCVCMFPLSML